MGKQRIKPNYRRRVLRLPDLDHCKSAVLNSLGSPASRRVYEYAIDQFIGHPAKIRAAETRKQKHDRRDARLILDLLMREDGFPEIWMPPSEQRDLRTLLRDRHQWVKIYEPVL